MASPRGFEPPTYSLGNRCSILLSYGDKYGLFQKAAKNPLLTPHLPSYYMQVHIFWQIPRKKTLAFQGFFASRK